MTFKYKYRKQIIGVFIFLFILIFIGSNIFVKNMKEKPKKSKSVSVVKEAKEKNEIEKDKEITTVKVDIKGKIRNPGIYTMIDGDRVIDVINKAGGLLDDADTSIINLSKKLTDEMVIIIYSHKQIEDYKKTKEELNKTLDICTNNDITNNACISYENEQEQSISTKININNASKEELMKIPGIGESKANDIIKYREKSKFKNIEEIKSIKGIGDNIFDKIKESITI